MYACGGENNKWNRASRLQWAGGDGTGVQRISFGTVDYNFCNTVVAGRSLEEERT